MIFMTFSSKYAALQWRHNERGCVSSPASRLFTRHLFRRRSKKASKFRVTGLCEENSPATGEFPAQRASNAENVSIWWRHHGKRIFLSSVAGCQLKPHDQDLWQPKHNTNINQALLQCFCLVWLQTNESSKIFYTPFLWKCPQYLQSAQNDLRAMLS